MLNENLGIGYLIYVAILPKPSQLKNSTYNQIHFKINETHSEIIQPQAYYLLTENITNSELKDNLFLIDEFIVKKIHNQLLNDTLNKNQEFQNKNVTNFLNNKNKNQKKSEANQNVIIKKLNKENRTNELQNIDYQIEESGEAPIMIQEEKEQTSLRQYNAFEFDPAIPFKNLRERNRNDNMDIHSTTESTIIITTLTATEFMLPILKNEKNNEINKKQILQSIEDEKKLKNQNEININLEYDNFQASLKFKDDKEIIDDELENDATNSGDQLSDYENEFKIKY